MFVVYISILIGVIGKIIILIDLCTWGWDVVIEHLNLCHCYPTSGGIGTCEVTHRHIIHHPLRGTPSGPTHIVSNPNPAASTRTSQENWEVEYFLVIEPRPAPHPASRKISIQHKTAATVQIVILYYFVLQPSKLQVQFPLEMDCKQHPRTRRLYARVCVCARVAIHTS